MAETKKETMMTPITIRVDMALKNRLADLAGQDGRELSSYVRRVMQLRLIAVFGSVVVAGILAVGFLFNALGI